MQQSGGNFQQNITMGVSFDKTGELNGSSNAKKALTTSALLNNKNDHKYCDLWSILASLHLCETNFKRVSNYRHFSIELNIDRFDFTYGLKCRVVHRTEGLRNLSVNVFELNFYKDQNKWKH